MYIIFSYLINISSSHHNNVRIAKIHNFHEKTIKMVKKIVS